MELELAPGMALQPAFVEPTYGKAGSAKRAFPDPALGEDEDFFGAPGLTEAPAAGGHARGCGPHALTGAACRPRARDRASHQRRERARERVTWLLARSKTEYASGQRRARHLAADAAFRESPDSATAQKLIYGEATRLQAMFSDYLRLAAARAQRRAQHGNRDGQIHRSAGGLLVVAHRWHVNV
ncbi:MAG: hypothetical protein IPL79_06400 [Myxococcales bacterium]|nr:hypothetical protein [Myxococcales bacterium]